jgi:hypothetical protein
MTENLDSLFDAARQNTPVPSETLMRRVLSDAEALQPNLWGQVAIKPQEVGSFWAGIAAVFGRGALTGMATAAVAGLWMGFSQPVGQDLFASLMGDGGAAVEFMPDIVALLDEEP